MVAAITELVGQFKAEATRAGAIVYEAKDTDDARAYVLRLLQERSAKYVVKSKSALADSIGLSQHLEKAGIVVTETDLEEWIAQQAGVKQVGGKSIEQLAERVYKATGEELKPEPQMLLNAASRALRKSCIDADLGISEADVAIAETGTLVMASSEGSTRLVVVLPRFHLTLVDYDSIVSTLEDAVAKLKSLCGNTNSKMPSYVTYLTGRNTTADIPGAILARAQGPAEEHMLLVNSAASKRGEK